METFPFFLLTSKHLNLTEAALPLPIALVVTGCAPACCFAVLNAELPGVSLVGTYFEFCPRQCPALERNNKRTGYLATHVVGVAGEALEAPRSVSSLASPHIQVSRCSHIKKY